MGGKPFKLPHIPDPALRDLISQLIACLEREKGKVKILMNEVNMLGRMHHKVTHRAYDDVNKRQVDHEFTWGEGVKENSV